MVNGQCAFPAIYHSLFTIYHPQPITTHDLRFTIHHLLPNVLLYPDLAARRYPRARLGFPPRLTLWFAAQEAGDLCRH